MQARLVALRQEEDEGHGAPSASPGGSKVTKVSDEAMLAKLSNEGWAEHVTHETGKE